MDVNDYFEEQTKLRLASGERYVICGDCGARLWSEDCPPGTDSDRITSCPYQYGTDGSVSMAQRMECMD